jgi:putative tryptophan/tyrosine transport system substrate-binding protein
MFNPNTAPDRGSYFLPDFEAAARSLKVETLVAPVRTDSEIETLLTSLGGEPGSGLVVGSDGFMQVHRAPIILHAARNRIPAVYAETLWVRDGGLISYGADPVDIFRRAAPYVDHVLRGAMPADLPVQLPTKFEMAVNVKTARALGLEVPPLLLARADEVVEQ